MPTDRQFSAFLFDMDGTVLNSAAPGERVWTAWANKHGLDPETFLPTIAGVRGVEVIAALALAGVDPVAEAEAVTQAEIDDIDGIHAIEGAVDFLRALPQQAWAIVTSSPRRLALRRLEAAGIPIPAVLVTAEDVTRGKPAPDCFLLGAQRLGVAIEDCLVFEDAAAGIAAAEAAGAAVMVVSAMHRQPMATRHPSIAGYAGIEAKPAGRGRLALASR